MQEVAPAVFYEQPAFGGLALRLLLVALLGGAGLPWCIGGRAALHDRWSGTRAVLEDESLGLPGFDRGLGAP